VILFHAVKKTVKCKAMPEKEEGHCRSSKAQQDWRQGETDLEMAAPH